MYNSWTARCSIGKMPIKMGIKSISDNTCTEVGNGKILSWIDIFLHFFLVFFFVFLIRDSPSFPLFSSFCFLLFQDVAFTLVWTPTTGTDGKCNHSLNKMHSFLSHYLLSFTILLAVFSVRSFTLLFFLSLTFPFFSLSHLLSFHFTFSYCPYFCSLFLHYFLFFISLSPFRFLLIYVSLSLKI